MVDEAGRDPTPLEISNMTYQEQMMLVEQRAERGNTHVWTYIESSKCPPAGYEIHVYPQEQHLHLMS